MKRTRSGRALCAGRRAWAAGLALLLALGCAAVLTPPATAAPLGIRIGLAWHKWAAAATGVVEAGLAPGLTGGHLWPATSMPAGGGGGPVGPVAPPAGEATYRFSLGGRAVGLVATESAYLAAAAAHLATKTALAVPVPPLPGGLAVRTQGGAYYVIHDPAAAAAADPDLLRQGLAQGGWPAFVTAWPAPPGGPGAGDGASAVCWSGPNAGLIFPADWPVRLTPSTGGHVRHAGRPYRGRLELSPAGEAGLLSVVNRVNVEDYLLGVVPSEMPASWPLEALKAQAVAARTYAVSNLGRHRSRGFDLCHDIHCQAYLGYDNEQPGPTAAVRATAGVVATYNGRLINAVYHAHAGGATDSSAAIWGSAEPYLVGTSETYEKPYLWTATNSRSEVEAAVARVHDLVPEGLFPLLAVTPVDFSAGGRARRVDLQGPDATSQMSAWRLRTGLGTYRLRESNMSAAMVWTLSAWADGPGVGGMTGSVPAVTWAGGARGDGVLVWYDRPVAETAGPTTAASVGPAAAWADAAYFVFSGEGFGHGVGMSQWGAREMAAIGKTYRQILTNFYRGIQLVPNYGR